MPATRRTAVSARPVKTGLPESAVQNYISQMCGWKHVAHYHTLNSEGSEDGFLDSFCIGPGGPLVLEAKDDDGQLSDAQKLWKALFESIGVRVLVVRPVDMRPRADLGGKSLIQYEIEKIATGPNGEKFSAETVAQIKATRSAAARDMVAKLIRQKGHRQKK